MSRYDDYSLKELLLVAEERNHTIDMIMKYIKEKGDDINIDTLMVFIENLKVGRK